MKKDESRRRFLRNALQGLSVAALGSQLYRVAPAQSEGAHAHVIVKRDQPSIRFAIHGGAGTILKSEMSAEREKAYRAALTEALMTGYGILKKGGAGLDAVEATIRIMEDSPLFNAGKGAVFTSAGTNELDASIMDGKTLKAGAVASLKHIKNPISLARLVMEKSKHVMMVGDGAESFAKEQGVELVPQSYFYTEERWKTLQREKAAEAEKNKAPQDKKQEKGHATLPLHEYGTVGAVALDQGGNLAAGTSTGGISNKKWGRVGDSPIIGAGTYANNRTCGVSATGDGEYFIRSVVAHDLSALMEYKGLSLKEAADVVIEKVDKLGGKGGLITIDKDGHIAMSFSTAGMYRGRVGADEQPVIEIYKD
ncbi:MAG: L-asparaginase / beta-aspartyl-peptidase [Acidobacteriota bacterium]|jgi:beta-aspartyl-peptidase (threonine type)|nr:L-asparaginase / beta-aspartyl-peptidase [Acidobacteriota bacterium]